MSVFGSEQASAGYRVDPADWRRAAHKCADSIYGKLTGEMPFFDSRIAYIAETGPKGRRVKRLAVMDSDGANHRFLTNGQTTALTPRWSPDYSKILYLSYSDGNPRIYVYDYAAGTQRLVTESRNPTFAPRWSPDGKSILYSMAIGGNTDIYIIGVNGGTPTRLTSDPGIDVGGSFSPNGKQIVFESDRAGSQQIYVMNVDGTGQKRLSNGQGRYATPEWSPRGDFDRIHAHCGRFPRGHDADRWLRRPFADRQLAGRSPDICPKWPRNPILPHRKGQRGGEHLASGPDRRERTQIADAGGR